MGEPFRIPETLIEKVSSGDRSSFRIFYEMTYPVIYRFIHYFLQNKNDCEEVVSEIYYTLWKQRAKLPMITDIKAWLFILSRNETYRYLKQKEKYSNISIDDLPVELSVDATGIEGKIIENEMIEIYNNAVNELPERCKLIFLMAREQHLKYREIAKILSITEGTVEQQMHIAIKKIVAVVKAYYPFIV